MFATVSVRFKGFPKLLYSTMIQKECQFYDTLKCKNIQEDFWDLFYQPTSGEERRNRYFKTWQESNLTKYGIKVGERVKFCRDF